MLAPRARVTGGVGVGQGVGAQQHARWRCLDCCDSAGVEEFENGIDSATRQQGKRHITTDDAMLAANRRGERLCDSFKNGGLAGAAQSEVSARSVRNSPTSAPSASLRRAAPARFTRMAQGSPAQPARQRLGGGEEGGFGPPILTITIAHARNPLAPYGRRLQDGSQPRERALRIIRGAHRPRRRLAAVLQQEAKCRLRLL